MPIALGLERTWPDCYDSFETSDATPEMRVLSDLPQAGDYAEIPTLHVIGLAADGSRGNTLLASYSIANDGAITVRTLLSNTALWGVGGLTIAVAVVGTEFQLTVTGLAGVDINWTVTWRLYQMNF